MIPLLTEHWDRVLMLCVFAFTAAKLWYGINGEVKTVKAAVDTLSQIITKNHQDTEDSVKANRAEWIGQLAECKKVRNKLLDDVSFHQGDSDVHLTANERELQKEWRDNLMCQLGRIEAKVDKAVNGGAYGSR